MTISLTQLQTFVRLSTLANFSRTAEELGVTPPAVTMQVRALSEHFGVSLIEVVKRRPVLTEAGRFLAQRSQAVLDDVAALEREMAQFTSALADHLVVGATLTIGDYVLAPLLAAFKSQHPNVSIDVKMANPTRLAQYLRSGRIMAALAAELPESAEFASQAFAQDHLVLIVPASGHRFSNRRTARASDLVGETFVGRETGAPTRTLAERELAAHGLHVNTQLVVPSWEGVTRAVEAGLGVAFVSSLVVERVAAQQLHVVEIRDLDLRRQFKLVTLRNANLSPRAHEFIEFLQASKLAPPAMRSR